MHRRLIASLVVAAGLPVARTAPAAILNWNNALGGAASTAGNWNPAQAPTAADDLTFNLNALYTVTFNASSASSRTHTYRIGTQTLVCSSPHTVSTGIVIGSTSPDIADVTLTTGTLNSTASVTIGSANFAQGTLRINDDDADLVLTGATADLTVGANAIGTLLITGGGLAVVPDQFIAGNNASSVADVTVSGALAVSPFTRSMLDVNGTSQSRFGAGGDATIAVSNGALASFAGGVVVANGSASTSTVTIGGSGGLGGLQRATLDIAGDFDVGRNVSAGIAAGVGTVTVNGGGTLDVAGTLNLGNDPDGGTGTLVMNSGAIIDAGSLAVGASGTLDLNGGTLDINGGTLSAANPLVLGGPSNPIVTLRSNATFSKTVVGGVDALIVGGGAGAVDLAEFDVRSGSDLSIPTGDAIVGQSTGDIGSMIISGSGSTFTLNAGALTVGRTGTAHFEAELGAAVLVRDLSVGSIAGGNGTLLIENAGTTAQIGQLGVGGTVVVSGGTGAVSINAGAVLTLTESTLAARVHAGGTFDVTNSTVNSAGDIEVLGGTVELDGNAQVSLTSARFLLDGGTLLGHPNGASALPGVIAGDFEALDGAVIRAVGGPLTLGDAGSGNGFRAISAGADTLIDCGAHTITALDSNGANIDDLALAGGRFASPSNVVTTLTTNITGFGTIDTPEFFLSGGALSPSGTGVRFTGVLKPVGATIAGTLVGFNSGGGYQGATNIAADVDADPGTTIAATGNFSMGRAGSAFGCTLDGTLLCQNHAVTLLDSNGVGLGTLTDLGTANGVRLICAQNLTVNSGRVLQGIGTIQTPVLTILGDVKPGDTVFNGPNGTGTIHNDGRISLQSSADFYCQIGNPIEGTNHDRLTCSLPAQVGGAIHASLEPGFTPFVGQFFDVVIGSTRTGTFAVEDCPGFTVVYLTDRVRLVFAGFPCDGDLNCDGNVDQDDVDALIATVAGDPQNFCAPDADINHDGNVDQDDVDAFIQFVAGGPCP